MTAAGAIRSTDALIFGPPDPGGPINCSKAATVTLRHTLVKFDANLAAIVMAICVALLGTMVLVIAASVFSRFVVFTPLNFAHPMSKYLMQWAAFLGVGLAIRTREHVLVDMLYIALKPERRRLLIILVNTLLTVLFVAVLWYGIKNALSARNSRDPFVFGMSMMIPYFSVPAGALYALIQTNLTTYLVLTHPHNPEAGQPGASV